MQVVPTPGAKKQVLKQLRSRIGEGKSPHRLPGRSSVHRRRVLVDEFLSRNRAEGGLLIEWLSDRSGAGASTIAFLVAREEQQQGRSVVVIDRRCEFYPPAAEALGLNVADLVVARPRSRDDALWAWEQSLRSARTTVIGHLERVPAQILRRLKLAVEKGGGLALLLRPLKLRSEPSWADLRLVATPVCPAPPAPVSLSRQVCVEALYVRGGFDRHSMIVDITDETASLSLVSQLAHPTPEGRPFRPS